MEIERYDVTLDIDFAKRKYAGEEKIYLTGTANEFILNSADPVIDYVALDGKKVSLSKGSRKDEFKLKAKFSGKNIIHVKFHADVSTSLMGLYSAKASDGSEMFTTQFESTGARHAFPCRDDPGWKAAFNLTLKVPKALDAISNMPEASVKISGEKKTIKFKKTPRMSTYLLYIGIGKFESKESSYGSKKVILSGLRKNLDSTDFPLTLGKQSLEFFDRYFGIKYALPKMHLISVPEFGAGAMENWGAITFREVALLVNKSTSGIVRKRVAAVIAHEIAHMWFGDLVTMKWWNDLWLNESFATFMMYKVVEHYYPEWNIIGEMLRGRASGAFRDDSLENTHPIDVEVKDPEKVAQIFDQISYGKGGMILRMIERYAGYEEFRRGIHDYLKKFSYSNATGKDLWKSVEKASGKPVSRVMGAWISEPGYPYIEVRSKGGKINLRQKRFFLDGRSAEKVWPVPLTVMREKSEEALLFDKKEIDIDAKGFVKLNVETSGFYRVLYDSALYENLLSRQNKMSYLDRWGVVSDLHAFMVSGRLDLAKFLSYLGKFSHESDATVVEEISAALQHLNMVDPGNKKISEAARNFYSDQLKRLGSAKKNESINDTILRGALSFELVRYDDAFAAQLAKKFGEIEKEVPDMRGAIAVAEAVHNGNVKKIIEKYGKLKSDEDRVKLIVAMGFLPGEKNVRAVEKLIDEGRIKKQDTISYYVYMSMLPENRDLAFEMMPDIVKRLSEIYTGTASPRRYIFQVVPFTGIGRAGKAKTVLAKLSTPLIDKGIAQGLEALSINEKLLKRLH